MSATGAIGTILVGYDEHKISHRALGRAALLAQALGARLVVTSVAPVATTAGGRSVGADPVETAAEHRAELAEARAYLDGIGGGVRVEYVEAVGHEADALLAAGREHAADLIVVGARQSSLVSRLFGSSVPDAVAHGASCDVLLVH